MALVDTDSRGLRHLLAALGEERCDRGEHHVVVTAPTVEEFELVCARAGRDTSVSGAVLYDLGPLLTLYFDDFDGSTYEVNWYKQGR